MRGYLADKSAATQFSALLIVWFLSFVCAYLLVAAILIIYHGPDQYKQIAEQSGYQVSGTMLKMLQILVSVGVFALPAFIMAFLRGEDLLASAGLQTRPLPLLLIATVPIIFSALPFIHAMYEMNRRFTWPAGWGWLAQFLEASELEYKQTLKQLLHMPTFSDFMLTLVMAAVVPAFCEELFFRGCLQSLLIALYRHIHLGILVTAAIFSLIHLQFYGFLPRLALGIILGYLFVWTGSLWYPLAAHLLYNGLQIVFLYLHHRNDTSLDMLEEAIPADKWLTFVSTGLMFVLLAMFRRKSRTTI